jgi:hypothetical protein
MISSSQAVVAARRNLSQRIERLLDLHRADPAHGLTGYQADKILDAMDHLQGGHFSDGEWMVLNAERRDLFEPRNYVRRGEPIDLGGLMARLKQVLANEG